MVTVPLELPPGVFRNGTPLQSKPRWRETQLVRWREGVLEPNMGWAHRTKEAGEPPVPVPLQVEGAARAAFSWRDNAGGAWLAIGTHSHLYAFGSGIDKIDITPATYTAGVIDAALSDGYGMGDYGEGDYGMPAVLEGEDAVYAPATMWTLDNWGENLLAQANTDGVIYEWAFTGLAEPVANAPVNNASFVVTNERILMAIGANDLPRLVKWSDQENNTEWTPDPLNQAGEQELHTAGVLIHAMTVPDGTLIWSTEDVWLARYLGQPFIYGFEALAGKCSLVSKQAIANIDNRVVWMGNNGFWMYDGFLKPLPCDVGDDLFSKLNRAQISKTWCLTNNDHYEAVWFYPSEPSNEIDSYVTWNWRDNYWVTGKIQRLCGVGAVVFPKPILIDASATPVVPPEPAEPDLVAGYLWNHATDYDYPGAEPPFAETWPIELGEAEQVMMVRKLIPDEITLGDVNVSFKTRQYPTGPEIPYPATGAYTLKNPTNLRLANKQVAIRFTGARPTMWRIGKMRFDVVALGRR